jgi:hypothetical protein
MAGTTKYYNNMPENDAKWYNAYSGNLEAGKANKDYYGWYENMSTKYGLKKHTLNENSLRDMSIKALGGDKTASEYLKWTQATPLSGTALWNNYDTSKGFGSNAAEADYMKTNPDSNYAINYDNKHREVYNDMIINDKPMTEWQRNWYDEMTKRRDIEDMNDPYVQQRYKLEKDKKSALDAQDMALNTGLSQMDANSFQQMQGLQQQMSDRGVADSGIASDAYMRAQMGNNQNYQQAYTDAASAKSDIQSKYNDAISSSKLTQQESITKKQAAAAEQAIKLQEIQSTQDKWMTEQTGTLYLNGSQVTVDGKPITTMEYAKMSEQQRHNLMQEQLDGTKIGNDYELGTKANDIKYELGTNGNNIKLQGINANLQVSLAKLQLDG